VYQVTEEGDTYLDRWAQDLRRTDRVLHHFLEAVEQNKEENQAE
jgi:DNA-binding PadR family transcriptional regulator